MAAFAVFHMYTSVCSKRWFFFNCGRFRLAKKKPDVPYANVTRTEMWQDAAGAAMRILHIVKQSINRDKQIRKKKKEILVAT
jgi:hypothetical protein